MAAGDDAYLTTMNEVLTIVLEFTEEARHSQNDVRMGLYLKVASRSLRCALEMYRDRLEQNRIQMKQGETAQ